MRRITTPKVTFPQVVVDAITKLATLDPVGLANAINLLISLASMPQASIALLIRNADNTAGAQEIPLTTAGTFQLVIDATGNVTLASAPSVVPIRSQDVTLDATLAVGMSKTVTWSTPFADANYSIIPSMNGLAGAVKVTPVDGSKATLTVISLVVGTITLTAVHKA